MPPLILASSSPYRQKLLERLKLPFDCCSPDIDESPLSGESAQQLVLRLAKQKADKVAAQHPQALIIGSDQVASLQGSILSKPGDHSTACDQLTRCSGNVINFYTGLTLLNSHTGHQQSSVETFDVHFRKLTPTTIERYLLEEQPYDCAGSFKMEGMGIILFDKLLGEDPNTLVGLPLIKLVSMLFQEGVQIPPPPNPTTH